MSTRTFPALGFDPAPGDLGEAEYLARIVRDASSTLEEVNSVVSSTATDGWRGNASEAFRDLVGDELAPAVRDANQSFDRAARALTTWTSNLADQQAHADNLERRAHDALGRLDSAEQALASVGDSPTAASFTSGGREPTEQELDHARQEHEHTLAARQSAVADAQGEYDAIVREAENLLAEAESAAATAAQALVDAGDIAPDKPGLLLHIGGAFSYIGSRISDAADWFMTHLMPIIEDLVDLVATTLVIASFFVPALALLAFAFAAGAVAIDLLRAADGQEGAMQEALVGAVGLGAGAAFGVAVKVISKYGGALFQPVIAGVSGGAATGGAVATGALTSNNVAQFANAGWLVTRFYDAKSTADAVQKIFQPATNLGERVRNTFDGNGPVTHQERSKRAAEAAS